MTEQERLEEFFGITDEGDIVSPMDLEAREEVPLCQEHLISLWDSERN